MRTTPILRRHRTPPRRRTPSPSAQGLGLGKALLAFAGRIALAAGLAEPRLYTNVRVARNVALHRGAGFVEAGTRPHPGRPGEALVDMAKRP